MLFPSIINNGKMRLAAVMCVSSTISRITADLRFLLGLINMRSVIYQFMQTPYQSMCSGITGRRRRICPLPLIVQSEYGFGQSNFVRRIRKGVRKTQFLDFLTGGVPDADNFLSGFYEVIHKIGL